MAMPPSWPEAGSFDAKNPGSAAMAARSLPVGATTDARLGVGWAVAGWVATGLADVDEPHPQSAAAAPSATTAAIVARIPRLPPGLVGG